MHSDSFPIFSLSIINNIITDHVVEQQLRPTCCHKRSALLVGSPSTLWWCVHSPPPSSGFQSQHNSTQKIRNLHRTHSHTNRITTHTPRCTFRRWRVPYASDSHCLLAPRRVPHETCTVCPILLRRQRMRRVGVSATLCLLHEICQIDWNHANGKQPTTSLQLSLSPCLCLTLSVCVPGR